MRHYRPATLAEREARAEQRRNKATDAEPIPPRKDDADRRQPFDWTFFCGGVTWALHFEPNPRDVRQWRVSRDGEPWMCAGLERVWRAMQREMGPALGRRNGR